MYEPSGRAAAKSIRIDQVLLDILEKKAEEENLSTNAFIENILLRYAKHYRYLEDYPVITLSQSMFHSIINEIPEENIEKLGMAQGKKGPRGYLLMRGLTPTLDSVIKVLEENYARGSSWFELHRHETNGNKILHCTHRNGLRWSKFLASYLTAMFEEILDIEVRVDITESYITIRI